MQGHALRFNAVQVERVAQPPARCPVDLDLGRSQEDSAPVENRDVLQPRLAEDRAFDAADAEAQAGSGLDLGDPVDDESMARGRVEHEQPDDRQRQKRDDEDEQLVREAAWPVPLQANAAPLDGFAGG